VFENRVLSRILDVREMKGQAVEVCNIRNVIRMIKLRRMG
jgi:hypothetical protein